MKERQFIYIALAIFAGLVLSGLFIGRSLERFRKEDRYISVKGFSEREVKSNLAVWTIKTRITSNDLSDASKEIESAKNSIIDFLLKNGIKQEEINQKNLNVTDKLAQEYGDPNNREFRYIVENSIRVRSGNVEHIDKVSRMTDELLRVGVIVAGNQDFNPSDRYIFTGLNEIKPEMLAEATRNAKKAAQEFTAESGVEIGDLRKASQGLFSIMDRDDYLSGQGEGGYYGSNTSDIIKKVRVVVNVDYSIR